MICLYQTAGWKVVLYSEENTLGTTSFLLRLWITVGYRYYVNLSRTAWVFELTLSIDCNGVWFVRIKLMGVKIFYILKMLLQVLTLFYFGVIVGYRHPMDSGNMLFKPLQSAGSNSVQFVLTWPLARRLFYIVNMGLYLTTGVL